MQPSAENVDGLFYRENVLLFLAYSVYNKAVRESRWVMNPYALRTLRLAANLFRDARVRFHDLKYAKYFFQS